MGNASEFGILATSRYVPRLRLERSEILAQHRWMAPGLKGLAKGQRAIANWDEDVITMAVEAARELRRGLPGRGIRSLSLVSTSLPFAERLNAGVVAGALGLPAALLARDSGSSARAATTELIAALGSSGSPQEPDQFVLTAERRIMRPASAQEMVSGDGAAAVAVGWGSPIATLLGTHTEAADFVDHFRQTGEQYDYGWEERWVRDEGYMRLAVPAVQTCMQRLGLSAGDVDSLVIPSPLARVNEAVARKLGIDVARLASTHAAEVGDLGCAQPLAMLDMALRQAQPGALVLVVAFGSGCDVIALRRTSAPCPGSEPAAGKSESSYMKYLSFTGQIELEWGMRAEMDNKTALTAAWRDHRRVACFEGGRCRACGTVQFPSGRLCVNPDCNAQDSQEPISLADQPARVMSHTSDYLAYTPHPPFQFGHIDFEGGGRVLMEFTDTDQAELQTGMRVRMVYRIKEFDARRGFRRYFWKATPLRDHV